MDAQEGPPSFEDVARLIAGNKNSAPKGLVECLRVQGASLCHVRQTEKVQPSRTAARKQLIDVRKAALILLEALDPDAPPPMTSTARRKRETAQEAILSALDEAGDSPLDLTGGLVARLQNISARAELAAASVPGGGGAGKFAPRQGGLSSKEICALVVAEAWKMVRGVNPGHNNGAVHEAVDTYWRAATREESIGSDASFGAWERHLKKAKSADPNLRLLIRQGLQTESP